MLRRLWVATLLSACAFALVGATTPSSATAQLTVTVTGYGTVAAGDHRLVCVVRKCAKTFTVPVGTVRLKATAAPTWKFTTWGRGCHGSTPTCSLSVRRSTRVTVTFVPPGARQNPIPLGQIATVREDWLLKVVSVTPHADDLVLAASHNSPDAQVPQGKEDYMVRLSAMYVGGSSGGGDLGNGLIGWIETTGSSGLVPYDTVVNGCPGTWPPRSFQHARGQIVSSGEWHTGNVCYLIASQDADSLKMFVSPSYPPSNESAPIVWFALR